MKFFKYLFVLLSLILMISCGGDEEEEDWGNDGDGNNNENNEGNGGWISQEGQDWKILETRGFTHIHSLAIGSNDTLYVGGTAQEESKKSDAFLVVFDAKGKELWSKQWDYQESADTVNKVVMGKHGNIYVIGGYIPFVIKFAYDGTKLWEQFPEFDDLYSLALDEEENVYVSSSYRDEIVKYSSDGKELQRYNISDEGITGISALTVDSKGNIYAGGYTSFSLFADNAGNKDAFLVKIAPDGTQLWGKQWGGEGKDQVKTMLLDNDDNIFIALGINEKTDLALRISPDGDKLWEIDQQCYPAAISNNNHIYCIGGNQIYKYNSKGECVGNYSNKYKKGYLNTIVCDSQENIYMSTTQSTKIIKISSSDFK